MASIKNYEIEVDSVIAIDDFDAYFTYAEHMDGAILTSEELDALSETHGHLLYEAAFEKATMIADFYY